MNESGTKCWFMSTVWVSAPSDTSETEAIDEASSVSTLIDEP